VKKILIAIIAAGVVSFAATSPAAAQSLGATAAVVKVPFQFIAGQRLLPAGNYRVDPQTADWSIVRISNVQGSMAALVTTQTVATTSADDVHSLLTFTKVRGQYFLQGVALPGRDARVVLVTKAEAERTLARLNLLNAEPNANAAK
jgi:hypothetical protein